eukprot:gene10989-12152_t
MSKLLKSAKQILSSNSLLRTKAYINGEWISLRRSFPVLSPATREVICEVTDADEDLTKSAIDAAKSAFNKWSEVNCKERSLVLKEFFRRVMDHKEELSLLMSAECGKRIAETRMEVNYGASFFEWFAEEAKRTYGDILPEFGNSSMGLITKQPVGVVGIITPWNSPLVTITRKLAAALAVGCTTVIKPSEETPLTALALAEIAEKAGIPQGVINVLPCSRMSTPAVGKLICESSDVRKITFTGSTVVGKKLMMQAANNVKRVSMELGGNAPFVVFDSADMNKVKEAVMGAKFKANGQMCTCANRFIVQAGIHDRFVEEMKVLAEGLRIGDPFDEETELSSLIHEGAVEKIDLHIQDSLKKGAKVVAGCERHPLGPAYYKPSILVDCTEDMLAMSRENFGPVIAIKKFETEDEAIRMMNNTEFGLAGYVFSEEMSQAVRVSKKMEVGLVGANEWAILSDMAPFGGIKESGVGKEGSKYGVDDYTQLKYVCLGGL